MEVSGQLHGSVAFPTGKEPSTTLIGGWVSPIAGPNERYSGMFRKCDGVPVMLLK
jgi:hypothetical protein